MKLFTLLVSFSALLVAGCAAFFSVKGIATLFSGAFIAALVMAGALEFGKLVATSFLYRWWHKCGFWLKTYLTTAVVILMFITSLGIFGFLSSAYQDSALKHEIHISKIENIENQKIVVESEMKSIDDRIQTLVDSRKSQEKRIDTITDQIGKTMTARSAADLQESTQKLIEETSADIQRIQEKKDSLFDKKMEYEQQVLDLKIGNEGSKDIQTFEFVAQEFNTDLDTVAKWFILVIIFVFDPLAVALVLAYNVMVAKEDDESPVTKIDIEDPDAIEKPDWPEGRVVKESDEKGIKISEDTEIPVIQEPNNVIKEEDVTEKEEPSSEPEVKPVVESKQPDEVWTGPFKPEHYNQKKT